MNDLIEAARALIERWDTPLWKEAEHTSEYINRLRAALDAAEAPKTLTDEQIDRIADNCAKAMPDGIRGFCKTWGWRQFARELLDVCSGHSRAAAEAPDSRDWKAEFGEMQAHAADLESELSAIRARTKVYTDPEEMIADILAQPAQEPVAWLYRHKTQPWKQACVVQRMDAAIPGADEWHEYPLTIAAPAAPVQAPLTREQIAKTLADAGLKADDYREDGLIEPLVWAIERAHGIGVEPLQTTKG